MLDDVNFDLSSDVDSQDKVRNILLRVSPARFDFLLSITGDFEGKQNTDRVNFALDKVSTLTSQLQNSIKNVNDFANQASDWQLEAERLSRELDKIKNAWSVLQSMNGEAEK